MRRGRWWRGFRGRGEGGIRREAADADRGEVDGCGFVYGVSHKRQEAETGAGRGEAEDRGTVEIVGRCSRSVLLPRVLCPHPALAGPSLSEAKR